MKAAKSLNTLANQQQNSQQSDANSTPTSPICRCRVMYLGSSVPHITKDGLQGIQEPLNELYPDKASLEQGNAGIDSWLSVWSNGILIENVDETGREMKRFFKIEALHYCAAVKFVPQLNSKQTIHPNQTNGLAGLPKFLPLDSAQARMQQNSSHPPIFASILRRTTGVKVLECHAFICKREAAANALVRCCFHAYADTMYAKQIGAEIDLIGSSNNGSIQESSRSTMNGHTKHNGAPAIAARRSKSIAALNDSENDTSGEFSDSNNRHNLHQHPHQQHQQQYSSSVSRRKSLNEGNYGQQNNDLSDASLSQQQQAIYGNQRNLHKQKNFSKSMHHLDQLEPATYAGKFDDFEASLSSNQSTSHHNLSNKHRQANASVLEPVFNPYASRIPSYPPQNIIDQQQSAGTGTLRSVKSVAANSIASTLLRSKKHAKAMSMAQLSQSNAQLNQQLNNERITSFHQPHQLYHQQMATVGPASFMNMPPVPPMFLPNIQARLPQINGSQTMKLPGRHTQPIMGPLGPINFETMSPKEIKKLLKKTAKYGIDPSRLAESGPPLMPLRPLPMAMHMQPPPPMMAPSHLPPPPPSNKSGTLGSQSLYSMDMHHDTPDYSSQTLPYMAPNLGIPPPAGPLEGCLGQGPMQPIKSILVKPNPEFLKSKAGKKWLKQQKEFKKLLPPHLDGLPIVFGPPPLDALEPADAQNTNGPLHSPPQFLHPPPPPPPPPASSMGLPVMDANGYYNPHPFYGPSGRASAASTLLRYSPHSQMMQQHQMQMQMQENGLMNGNQEQIDFMQQQAMYSDPSALISQHQQQQRSGKMNGLEPVYSSQLNTFDRQFQPLASERAPRSRHHQQMRNHMVEQSVISLGDENDADEDAEEIRRHEDDDDGQLDGYYDRVGSTSTHSMSQQHQQSRHRSRRSHQQATSDYDEAHQQQAQSQANDDHSSHSSGIYRRKHINERAFSYSIRQEHMSNGGGNTSNSEADYVTDNGADYSDSQQQNYHPRRSPYDTNNNNDNGNRDKGNYHVQQRTYDSPQQMQPSIYQNRSQLQYARNSLQQQQPQQHQPPPPPPPQVEMDLSARLEQQLNMKSFANSGVKSHI